jgi:nucleotide-binding universal stress UspA family protein
MKILICSDGSERSKRAISFAAIIAAAAKAEATVFGITQNQQEEAGLKEILVEESRELEARGVRVETAMKSGDPVTEIVQWTRDRARSAVARRSFSFPRQRLIRLQKQSLPQCSSCRARDANLSES